MIKSGQIKLYQVMSILKYFGFRSIDKIKDWENPEILRHYLINSDQFRTYKINSSQIRLDSENTEIRRFQARSMDKEIKTTENFENFKV